MAATVGRHRQLPPVDARRGYYPQQQQQSKQAWSSATRRQVPNSSNYNNSKSFASRSIQMTTNQNMLILTRPTEPEFENPLGNPGKFPNIVYGRLVAWANHRDKIQCIEPRTDTWKDMGPEERYRKQKREAWQRERLRGLEVLAQKNSYANRLLAAVKPSLNPRLTSGDVRMRTSLFGNKAAHISDYMRHQRIEQENRQLSSRLQKVRTSFDLKQMEKDFQRYMKHRDDRIEFRKRQEQREIDNFIRSRSSSCMSNRSSGRDSVASTTTGKTRLTKKKGKWPGMQERTVSDECLAMTRRDQPKGRRTQRESPAPPPSTRKNNKLTGSTDQLATSRSQRSNQSTSAAASRVGSVNKPGKSVRLPSGPPSTAKTQPRRGPTRREPSLITGSNADATDGDTMVRLKGEAPTPRDLRNMRGGVVPPSSRIRRDRSLDSSTQSLNKIGRPLPKIPSIIQNNRAPLRTTQGRDNVSTNSRAPVRATQGSGHSTASRHSAAAEKEQVAAKSERKESDVADKGELLAILLQTAPAPVVEREHHTDSIKSRKPSAESTKSHETGKVSIKSTTTASSGGKMMAPSFEQVKYVGGSSASSEASRKVKTGVEKEDTISIGARDIKPKAPAVTGWEKSASRSGSAASSTSTLTKPKPTVERKDSGSSHASTDKPVPPRANDTGATVGWGDATGARPDSDGSFISDILKSTEKPLSKVEHQDSDVSERPAATLQQEPPKQRPESIGSNQSAAPEKPFGGAWSTDTKPAALAERQHSELSNMSSTSRNQTVAPTKRDPPPYSEKEEQEKLNSRPGSTSKSENTERKDSSQSYKSDHKDKESEKKKDSSSSSSSSEDEAPEQKIWSEPVAVTQANSGNSKMSAASSKKSIQDSSSESSDDEKEKSKIFASTPQPVERQESVQSKTVESSVRTSPIGKQPEPQTKDGDSSASEDEKPNKKPPLVSSPSALSNKSTSPAPKKEEAKSEQDKEDPYGFGRMRFRQVVTIEDTSASLEHPVEVKKEDEEQVNEEPVDKTNNSRNASAQSKRSVAPVLKTTPPDADEDKSVLLDSIETETPRVTETQSGKDKDNESIASNKSINTRSNTQPRVSSQLSNKFQRQDSVQSNISSHSLSVANAASPRLPKREPSNTSVRTTQSRASVSSVKQPVKPDSNGASPRISKGTPQPAKQSPRNSVASLASQKKEDTKSIASVQANGNIAENHEEEVEPRIAERVPSPISQIKEQTPDNKSATELETNYSLDVDNDEREIPRITRSVSVSSKNSTVVSDAIKHTEQDKLGENNTMQISPEPRENTLIADNEEDEEEERSSKPPMGESAQSSANSKPTPGPPLVIPSSSPGPSSAIFRQIPGTPTVIAPTPKKSAHESDDDDEESIKGWGKKRALTGLSGVSSVYTEQEENIIKSQADDKSKKSALSDDEEDEKSLAPKPATPRPSSTRSVGSRQLPNAHFSQTTVESDDDESSTGSEKSTPRSGPTATIEAPSERLATPSARSRLSDEPEVIVTTVSVDQPTIQKTVQETDDSSDSVSTSSADTTPRGSEHNYRTNYAAVAAKTTLSVQKEESTLSGGGATSVLTQPHHDSRPGSTASESTLKGEKLQIPETDPSMRTSMETLTTSVDSETPKPDSVIKVDVAKRPSSNSTKATTDEAGSSSSEDEEDNSNEQLRNAGLI